MWTIELLDNSSQREAQYVLLSRSNTDYILGRNAKRNASAGDECVPIDIYSAADKYISKRLLVCRIIDGGNKLLCYAKNNLGSIKSNLAYEARDETGVEKYSVNANACMSLDICENEYTIKVYCKDNQNNKSPGGVFQGNNTAKSIKTPAVLDSSKRLTDTALSMNNKSGMLSSFKDHKLGKQAHSFYIIPSSEAKIYQDPSNLNHDLGRLEKMAHEESTKGKNKSKVTKTNNNQVTKRQEKELQATNLAKTLFQIKKKANEKLDSPNIEQSNNVEINTAKFTIRHEQKNLERKSKMTSRVVNYKKFRKRASNIEKIKPEEYFQGNKLSMTKYVDTSIPTFKTMKDLKADISPKKLTVNNHKNLFLED